MSPTARGATDGLTAEGIELSVPPGWEARILGRDAPFGEMLRKAAPTGEATRSAARHAPEPPQRTGVVHLATFPIPPGMGDFGGNAVNLMLSSDVLVVLFEFGGDSVGAPLFRSAGLPRLRPIDFDARTLRQSIPGQSAVQRFFTVSARPFSLYVVLGSHLRRVRTVPLVNQVLKGLAIAPR